VIGAGIGAAHVEAYRDNRQGYEVALICDLDADRAAKPAVTVPDAGTSTSFAAALARPDIDLVDICLPPYLHLDTIEAALAAGKHVLCEKPLVGSLADVERVMRAAEHARLLRVLLQRPEPGDPLVGQQAVGPVAQPRPFACQLVPLTRQPPMIFPRHARWHHHRPNPRLAAQLRGQAAHLLRASASAGAGSDPIGLHLAPPLRAEDRGRVNHVALDLLGLQPLQQLRPTASLIRIKQSHLVTDPSCPAPGTGARATPTPWPRCGTADPSRDPERNRLPPPNNRFRRSLPDA
jgi:hypothetical protein